MTKPHLITGREINPARLVRARALRRNPTAAEKRLWHALRANRLDGFHFRRQQIIGGFIVDFYCHAAGLVIEVDGPVHEAQADDDAARDRRLQTPGLYVLRLRNDEVIQNMDSVLNRIRDLCHSRTASPPPPCPERREAGGGVPADLTPRPPSLKGKGETLPSPHRGGAGGGVS